jgi:glycosyltransferase involved in cell wall biosynthesis
MNPKVSVIIPTYNRAKILPRTIESVLNQTFKDFELIIVDDGSTDNTKQTVGEFQKRDSRVKYIWQENFGAPAGPKNTGIKNAKGKYIAFLDDDDEWLPEKLERQIKLFSNSSGNLGFVGCNILVVEEKTKKIIKKLKMPSYPKEIFLKKLLEGNFIFTSSSILIKREVLNKVGLFDTNLKYADDWDLWLRISENFSFDFVPEYLLKYYIHQKGITINLKPFQEAEEHQYILEKYQKYYQKYPSIYSIHLRKLASRYCASGKMKEGRKYYLSSIKTNPLNLKSYLYFSLSLLGEKIYRGLYNFRKSLNR